MDANTNAILKKSAEYIEMTQPIIDRQNEKRASFLKRANQTAAVLAHRGVISKDAINTFVDKIAADENEVWSLVEKLAEFIRVDELGASAEKVASGPKMGPWDRLYHYGSSRADTRTPGMVE